MCEKLDFAKIILQNGALLTIKNLQHKSPIEIAISNKKLSSMKTMMYHEKTMDKFWRSSNPFALFFWKQQSETSLILLQSVASLIGKDEKGNIAMELSLKWNGMEVFKTIVAFQQWRKRSWESIPSANIINVFQKIFCNN